MCVAVNVWQWHVLVGGLAGNLLDRGLIKFQQLDTVAGEVIKLPAFTYNSDNCGSTAPSSSIKRIKHRTECFSFEKQSENLQLFCEGCKERPQRWPSLAWVVM